MKIIDVAKRAKVSTATVSRVINNSNKVSEKTRKKVIRVIEELNYQPHTIARQFRLQETKTILITIPNISNSFFSDIIHEIEKRCRENKYCIILGITNYDSEIELDYLKLLSKKQIDGAILVTPSLDANKINEIFEKHPLVVACNHVRDLNCPDISVNNFDESMRAIEFLIINGHRNFGFIGGPESSKIASEREKGFYFAMRKAKLTIDQKILKRGGSGYIWGYNSMNKILSLTSLPSAIMVCNNEAAIGALEAIKHAELNSPIDISLTSFNNVGFSILYNPSLAKISRAQHKIGTTVVDRIIEMIRGG